MKSKKGNLRWLWLAVLIIAIDQISKHVVLYHLPYAKPIALLPFFNLTLAFNTGAAFSFLHNESGWQQWLFAGIAILVSLAIIIYLSKMPKNKKLLACALTLILGGALGNVSDRLFRGYVIDFADFHANDWHWPAFNVADTAICIGAFLFVITLFFKSGEKHAEPNV